MLAAVLLIGAVVGGTIAYLFQETQTVTNTFTVGDINITLKETGTVADGDNQKKEYTDLLPGSEYEKDPTITVKGDSESCYLFVKVVENNNTVGSKKVLDYSVITSGDKSWTELTGIDTTYNVPANTKYYFQTVTKNEADQTFQVLTANKVIVKSDIEKTDVTTINYNTPSIVFTAAAVQSTNIATPQAAFATLSQSFTGTKKSN